jgi:hypothetical protein
MIPASKSPALVLAVLNPGAHAKYVKWSEKTLRDESEDLPDVK